MLDDGWTPDMLTSVLVHKVTDLNETSDLLRQFGWESFPVPNSRIGDHVVIWTDYGEHVVRPGVTLLIKTDNGGFGFVAAASGKDEDIRAAFVRNETARA